MLEQVRKLYDMGGALLLLHPESKRPVATGWTKAPRATWEELQARYRKGMNVGIRLGAVSKIGEGYLAVVDCDLKDESYAAELADALNNFLPNYGDYPIVNSGRGNGSMHIYVTTAAPIKERKIAGKKGKWEIVLMGEGRQVVLPPSVHPDTGKHYAWRRGVGGVIPLLELVPGASNLSPAMIADSLAGDFIPETVDLSELQVELQDAIIKGPVPDRSAYLMTATNALLRARFTDNQILSVLTDRGLYLGNTAYDHAHTDVRQKAAQWVQRHTLHKAHLAIDAKYDFPDGTDNTATLTDQQAEKQAERLLPVLDWQATLERNQKTRKLKDTIMNVFKILKGEFGDLFHLDEFAVRVTYAIDTPWGEKAGQEITDSGILEIIYWLATHYSLEPKKETVYSAMYLLSRRNGHHPLREYLDRVQWDGNPRIDTWLKDYAKVEVEPQYEPYLRAISRKVLCAMVARAYYPGIKFDHVLILEGPLQGEGKSRTVQALASPAWAGTVRFDMDQKDFVLALQGRWASEISELSGLGKRGTNFVKAIISENQDRIRHPYGRLTDTLPRQGIFIGTTNHYSYLEDETGNRRFWPVHVGTKIDVEGIARDRDQLFAEAKFCFFEEGEALYLEDPAIEQLAREVQGNRVSETGWEDLVRDFLVRDKLAKDVAGAPYWHDQGFKTADLFAQDGPLYRVNHTPADHHRGVKTLHKLGFKMHNVRLRNTPHKVSKVWRASPETQATLMHCAAATTDV